MTPIQSVAMLGLAPLILLIVLLGLTSHRVGARALGTWLLAWSALLASGWLIAWVPQVPELRPVGFLFSSTIGPLMLAGAYEHVGRPVPSWVLPSGFVIGVARMGLHLSGHPTAGYAVAVVTDPALVLLAGVVATRLTGRPFSAMPIGERILGATFLVYSIAECLDARMRMLGEYDRLALPIWIAGGFPLFAAQTALAIHRLGRSVMEQEDVTHSFEERLKLITQATRDVVVEVDERGRITFLGPNADHLGLAPGGSLLGADIRDFYPADTAEPIARQLLDEGRITEDVVAASRPRPFPARTSAGGIRWYETELTSYRTADGALRVLGRLRDVTERRRDERAAAERERRLNRAERLASLGSWEYHPETDFVYWSDQHFRLFGLEPRPGGPRKRDFEDAIPPGYRERMAMGYVLGLEVDGVIELDYQVRRANDGSLRTLRVLAELDRDASGRIVRVAGATMDVTERVELEARLRREQRQLRMLIDSNILGVCFGSPSGRMTEANDAFLQPLGYEQSDLPLDWIAITPEDLRPRDLEAIEEIRRTGAAQPYEKAFFAKNGARIPMLVGAATMGDDGQVLVVTQDLSARKRAEAYVERHQKQLEQTVADRTRELVESKNRLVEAERLAAIGTLAAGVAHQINNPIGAILNSSEYALLCAEEAEAAAIYERALRTNLAEARRCARIVRSMLQFARDEPTAKWIEDLGRILQRARRAIAPYATDRSAEVSVHVPAESVLVRVSPIEIEQALVNVLRNGIESRDGGAIVVASLETRDKIALIEVVDDGRGLDERERERAFVPFYSTRTRVGGTGLGLSVAHGIVTDHGGTIRIESEAGVGTRVVIALPLAEVEPEPIAHAPSPPDPD